MSEEEHVRLRLFGLRGPRMNRVEQGTFPLAPGLTVARLWSELQRTAEPGSLLAGLQRELVLALVNGVPIHRLQGWETELTAGDTVTLMLKAFGG